MADNVGPEDSKQSHGARKRRRSTGRRQSRAPRPRREVLRYVYWRDGQFWLGYLEEFPDYMTQGETHADLKEHLRDVYKELTSGQIPGVRRVATLEVA